MTHVQRLWQGNSQTPGGTRHAHPNRQCFLSGSELSAYGVPCPFSLALPLTCVFKTCEVDGDRASCIASWRHVALNSSESEQATKRNASQIGIQPIGVEVQPPMVGSFTDQKEDSFTSGTNFGVCPKKSRDEAVDSQERAQSGAMTVWKCQ